jgi:zinc transporter
MLTIRRALLADLGDCIRTTGRHGLRQRSGFAMTTTHATTLSPAAALLWAYRFAEDGTHEAVPSAEVDAALATSGGWFWIHAGLADTRCRVWLEQNAPASPLTREILLGPDEHLRLGVTPDAVAGVLPDLQRELAQASMEFARFRFVMTERMLITARRHPLHSVELARRSVEGGVRFLTAASLLDCIIDHFADALGRLAVRLGDELEVVEDRVLRDDLSDERRRVGRARLQIVRVHRQLARMKVLFHRIEPRVAASHAALSAPLSDLIQKLDALEHDFGSLQERSRYLQDEVATKMTAITNRRLFTLSILTACLMPPTLVTGFFGMNTKDLPFQQIDAGTWYALGLCVLAAGVAYWALRRLRAL